MNYNITARENVFSKEMCEQLVSFMGEGLEATVGPPSENQEKAPSEIRKSNVTFLPEILNNYDVYRVLMDLVYEVNKEHYNFHLHMPETIQLTKYDSQNQGHYAPHTDSSDVQQNAYNLPRKLSVVVQLSCPDSYEGGDLIFPDAETGCSEAIKPQGTAIIFPSYVLHGVTPVTSGVRHSLVSWIIGPNFR